MTHLISAGIATLVRSFRVPHAGLEGLDFLNFWVFVAGEANRGSTFQIVVQRETLRRSVGHWWE